MAQSHGNRQKNRLPSDGGTEFFRKRPPVSGLRKMFGRLFGLARFRCTHFLLQTEILLDIGFMFGDVRRLVFAEKENP